MNENCRKSEPLFVDALYNELTMADQRWFDAHLASCSDCKAEFKRLQGTLRIMDEREQASPSAEFWEGYWDRLAEKLPESNRETVKNVHKMPVSPMWQWSYRAVAAAAILVVGIFLGRNLFTPGILPSSDKENDLIQAAAVQDRTFNYLEKSKVLLLGVVTIDEEEATQEGLDFSGYQKASRNLVREAVYLKEALKEPRQQRLRKLVSDLEIILLQIASLEAENNLSAIEIIRHGVDRRGILLKINLEEINQGNPEKNDIGKSGAPQI